MAKKKILIIDDDIDYAESIKLVLMAKGYDASYALDRQKGLEMIERSCPDLIIMDVMMERMSDGFDLSRKLKCDEKYKNIPILILTAVGDKTGFKFSTEAGDEAWLPVDAYVEKPIKPEELVSKVEKLLK
ncbi:MAG: PleD family two-component system response regulator [Candidatus Omnitrophota bacterium]